MTTVLITGANRGLGLEFCKQYAAAGFSVIACCRAPAQAEALQNLQRDYPAVRLERLDVADFQQIDALAARLAGQAIDILINNAGVYGDKSGQGFGNLDYSAWMQTLIINTQAPVKMAEALLANLKLGQHKIIANVSSLMGSMADNSSGGSLLYRSSKAALNAVMKSLALDIQAQGIGVLILHPGWVRTDMGGPNGLIDAPESIAGMRQQIATFTLAQSGRFVKYDSQVMPW